jgi:hypothetical protein
MACDGGGYSAASLLFNPVWMWDWIAATAELLFPPDGQREFRVILVQLRGFFHDRAAQESYKSTEYGRLLVKRHSCLRSYPVESNWIYPKRENEVIAMLV